jgi:hypothetical protein
MPTTRGAPLIRHGRRSFRDEALGGYASPPSSDFSSDDEVAEYMIGAPLRARSTHRSRTKVDGVRYPAMADAFRGNRVSASCRAFAVRAKR